MKVSSFNGYYAAAIRNVPDDVHHHGPTERARGAEWQPQDSTQMIFELARLPAFDRPVSRIVHARSHFVRKQLPIHGKQFEGENTNVLEPVHQTPAVVDRERRSLGSDVRRWCSGFPKNPGTMHVLDWRIEHSASIDATHSNHRQLVLKLHELFGDGRSSRDLIEAGFCGSRVPHDHLTLTVVAHRASLEHQGHARLRDRALEILG